MKKILFIILALLLLASSTNALPWKLNATRDIDWSSYPVQVFTGTTGEELEAFIIAHGAGTYLLKNKVVISEEMTISDNYVCIGSSGSHRWPYQPTGPVFEVTMTSGRAINMSADYCTLDHPTIHFTNTTSTATAVCINKYWAEVISPSIFAAKGTGIEFIGSSYFYDISNADIIMDEITGLGTAFYFNSNTNGLIHGGTIGGGAIGMHIVEGHPMLSFVYFINQSAKGIFFDCEYANSCGDVSMMGGCIDYQSGVAVDTSGTYRVDNVLFSGVSGWEDGAGASPYPVFYLDNVHNWKILDSQGWGSSTDTPIVIHDKATDITIDNCHITAYEAGDNGIYIADDAEIGDLKLTSNSFDIASGVGILIAGVNPTSYTVMMNTGTTSGCTNATNKFCAYNRPA